MKFALAAFLLFLAGCASTSNSGPGLINPALLEPQANLKYSDLPAPAGFKYLPKESYSFETEGVRVCFLKYSGNARPEQVINFYKEQMAMSGWNLLNVVEYGQRLLNFDRQAETCIVSLLPKFGGLIITISVGPKTPGSRAKEKLVK